MKEKKRDWAISAGFLGVLLTAYVINYRFGFLEILDFHIEKVKKAYPAYFGTYDRMGKLTAWLNKIENLFCIGRNAVSYTHLPEVLYPRTAHEKNQYRQPDKKHPFFFL